MPKKPRELIYYERWWEPRPLPTGVQRVIDTGDAAFRAQEHGEPVSSPGRRSRLWFTDVPKIEKHQKRPHRATGRPRGRPRNDDTGAKQAVKELQADFGLTGNEAVRVVAPTIKGDDAPKTPRTKTSMRERLKKP